MSGQVKGVTDVVKEVHDLNKHAATVADEMRKNIADVKDALAMTQELSTALRDAGAELRGTLGIQTNNPPKADGQ
jgi:ABC-type transporter Mla subunit MlaD